MIRKIINIDEEKCNGCGACASACHEGAIAMIDGKAKLLREDYCDGLGDCLPACPAGAISFVEREALEYDASAVDQAMRSSAKSNCAETHGGCPGSQVRRVSTVPLKPTVQDSQLAQWPCQIKLAPVNAPFFQRSHMLIAADCTAYAYANMHWDFMHGRITLIACPKLDGVDYSEKLLEIVKNNDIKDITVVRMEVPCCGGLTAAVKKAVLYSGKSIDINVVTISVDGKIK